MTQSILLINPSTPEEYRQIIAHLAECKEKIVIHFYNQGSTQSEIAEQMNISPREVSHILTKAEKSGVKVRDSRKGRPRNNITSHPIDQLKEVGDAITIQGVTRQAIHQAAALRAFKVSVRQDNGVSEVTLLKKTE